MPPLRRYRQWRPSALLLRRADQELLSCRRRRRG